MRQCLQLPSGQTDWPRLLRSSRVHNQNLPQFLPQSGANVHSRVSQAGKDSGFLFAEAGCGFWWVGEEIARAISGPRLAMLRDACSLRTVRRLNAVLRYNWQGTGNLA